MQKTLKQILTKRVYTPEQLAKKHNVDLQSIMQQLEMGIEVEKEHTKHKTIARQIALAHLAEFPDYYSRLKKIEK